MKQNLKKLNKKSYSRGVFIIFLSALGLIGGCRKDLQIPPPNTQLDASQVFNNAETVTSALTGIYQQMFNNFDSYQVSLLNGLLGDELINYASNGQLSAYHDAMTAVNSPGFWVNYYQYIYQANAIISGLRNNNKINQKVINQLIGEAKFTRAFSYFYLVNMYGDVPLTTTTDYSVNNNLARTPKATVYQQIVNDLTSAEQLLNTNYVDATDTTITTARVRPNQAAAAALLARVYLYTNKYSQAIAEASKVINNSVYQLVSPLTQTNYVFNIRDNSEAIWQIAQPSPPPFNGATCEGFLYPILFQPGNVSLSLNLMNSFEPGDQRKIVWVGTYSNGSQTYYYPSKYKVNLFTANPNNITEYEMVLRLAEQYLIRAEAEANSNDPAEAVNDLNVIRNRAGLPNYNGATDQASLLAAILHERQVELFTEWGNRWFDLIRTNNVNSVMSEVAPQKGGKWNPNSELYPIPLGDIKADPKLVQNPGY